MSRDWGWAPEYVEAIWLMLRARAPDDYVIATGQSHTLQQFTASAFSAVGLIGGITSIPIRRCFVRLTLHRAAAILPKPLASLDRERIIL